MAFDFPSSPAEGQVFNAPGGPSYVFNSPLWRAVGQGQIAIIADAAPSNPANGTLWLESDTGLLFAYWNDGNSSQWVQVGGNAASGAIVTTVITTSGTYTKPVGLCYLEVWAIGGGGGGSRAGANAAGNSSAGAGGGGGATVYQLYAASALAASEPYTIGAGGTASGGVGAAGSSSVFKGLTAGGGGGGGSLMTASSTFARTSSYGIGGTCSGGMLNIRGGAGDHGYAAMHGVGTNAQAGRGGNSFFAPGIYTHPITGAAMIGHAGMFPGGGGSGQSAGNGVAVDVGNAGSDGCIIFKEYF